MRYPFGVPPLQSDGENLIPQDRVPLKPLHSDRSLSQPKLDTFRKLSTDELIDSLFPGESGALKVKPDGTIMDGHHRIHVLRERGVEVDALPREHLP
jgi:hypothetical protein